MTTATRRAVLAVVTVVVLVALGAGLGLVVGDALGIRTEPATQMEPAAPVVPASTAVVPAPEFTRIDAPATVRVDVALEDLADAAAAASETEGAASLTVVAGAGDDDDETYQLTGSTDALRIEAASETGAVRGIYDLAAQVRAGRSVTEHLGEEITSRLPFRMVDMGAVAVTPDPAEWAAGDDYSHASKAFADVLLPDPPYIDPESLSDAYDDFDVFIRHSLANGYNAVAFPGLVEYLTFDDAPDGPVYAEGDDHRAKALALREAFAPFWARADELGMQVFLRTDMLTLTTPLEEYLTAQFGSLETANPELWDVYAAGLDELYAAEPSLDGVLIRIGEAGRVYDVEGWDVYSALAVTSVDSVRTMLETLTAQAETADREVIFRTWSVGVGAVGDMHTNDQSYEAVLGGIDSPALIVSTKYTLGDFYSWLPLNVTLEQGEQRRIVEFQSRREFENFGAFPNDLGPEYQFALQKLLAANENIEGVWTWTQDGGPWRAGPMTLYLKAGFWQLYELNTMLAADLARDPSADVGRITEDWARQWFSDDPATVAAIVQAMSLSRPAIEQGMYIEPFAEQRVFAIGLEPPPMMWIFEWDILTGDSAVLDVIYAISRDATGGDIEQAIAGGDQALADVESMRDLVEATDAATWHDASVRDSFLGTMDYEVDVLRLLASYRAMILHQAQWHDTVSADAYAAWKTDRDEFETLAAAHVEKYTGNIDYPAYNLTAAELGVQRADRDMAMAWIARGLLLLAGALGRDRRVRIADPARPPSGCRRRTGRMARRDAAVARPRVDARAAALGPLAAARHPRGPAGGDPCGADLVPLVDPPRGGARRVAHLPRGGAAAGAPSVSVAGHRRGRRGRRAALHRDAARTFGHRAGRLLVLVLDRAHPPDRLHRDRVRPVRVAVRRRRLGARVADRPPAGDRDRAGRHRRGAGRARPRDRPRRARSRAHGLERRDGSASLGSRAHPGHHCVPRHPGGDGVVRRRLRPRDRRGRRAARAALRASRSTRRARG